MKVRVDGKAYTLDPLADANRYTLVNATGARLGIVRRKAREETHWTVNPRRITFNKIEKVYWVAAQLDGVGGRLHDSRAAAIRWLVDPPAWWLRECDEKRATTPKDGGK